ncbi:hypothetical protein A6V36_01700 [Paraburkholderia ginsengiterrae]|uniref:Uncharacterized protein n=1 Tax=Paraburkholderia ginsengiterrae TaxID=1462993 RepID=A0A1A9NCW4_9BURK|nr:hypothetical protein [Paraburkholderia ginsengiterrae]OAJ60537.1 hypothetical protein A6V36_01700 [Paraburkholderia ginsengiterrae]OAJ64089.1 hypothetical protein A6V37_00895 [Paraburkholderia ginsengiterrae]
MTRPRLDTPDPDGLDDEAQAELLCYLVVAQLITRTRTGHWLRTDHLVESTRIWLTGNGAHANWSERIRLAALSEKLAQNVTSQLQTAAPEALAKLFTDGWRLDYRSPVVRGIHAACKNRLQAC